MFGLIALLAVGLFVSGLVSGSKKTKARRVNVSAVDYATGNATTLKPYKSDSALAPSHYNDV